MRLHNLEEKARDGSMETLTVYFRKASSLDPRKHVTIEVATIKQEWPDSTIREDVLQLLSDPMLLWFKFPDVFQKIKFTTL